MRPPPSLFVVWRRTARLLLVGMAAGSNVPRRDSFGKLMCYAIAIIFPHVPPLQYSVLNRAVCLRSTSTRDAFHCPSFADIHLPRLPHSAVLSLESLVRNPTCLGHRSTLVVPLRKFLVRQNSSLAIERRWLSLSSITLTSTTGLHVSTRRSRDTFCPCSPAWCCQAPPQIVHAIQMRH